MARVVRNVVTEGLVGSLGGQLVLKRDRGGRTIVTRKPHFAPDRVFTPAQLARHEAFREAAAYASHAQHNPVYARMAAGTPRCPYNVAIGDWLNPPTILDVLPGDWGGRAGQVIRIQARDDVLVARVTVTISDSEGALLETGNAVQMDDLWWEYIPTCAPGAGATLLVSAQDLPGHTARLEVHA